MRKKITQFGNLICFTLLKNVLHVTQNVTQKLKKGCEQQQEISNQFRGKGILNLTGTVRNIYVIFMQKMPGSPSNSFNVIAVKM